MSAAGPTGIRAAREGEKIPDLLISTVKQHAGGRRPCHGLRSPDRPCIEGTWRWRNDMPPVIGLELAIAALAGLLLAPIAQYAGFGRNAFDNNVLNIMLWYAFRGEPCESMF